MRVMTLLIPVALLAAGCNSSAASAVTVHPVKGQVLYEGKPAAGVGVTFLPTDAPTVPQIPQFPSAVTGPDGRFEVTTFAPGDGAAEGGYIVVFNWPRSAAPADGEGEVDSSENDRLLGWYDATHTKYSARVKAGPNELPPFKLDKHTTPAGRSEGIPGRN